MKKAVLGVFGHEHYEFHTYIHTYSSTVASSDPSFINLISMTLVTGLGTHTHPLLTCYWPPTTALGFTA